MCASPVPLGGLSRASKLRVVTLRMGNGLSKLTPRLESKELWGICEDDQATYCTRRSTSVSSGGGRSSVRNPSGGQNTWRHRSSSMSAPMIGRPNRKKNGPAIPQAFPTLRDLRGSAESCRSIDRRTEISMPGKQSGDAHSPLQSSWWIRGLLLPKPFCNSRSAVALQGCLGGSF
jgi:hypothetical protein